MEIGETRVIALLFFDVFVSLSNFRFESQSDVIQQKSMTNYYDKSVRYYLFFKLPHLLLAIPSSNEGWLQKRKWANELIIMSRITFERMKKFIRFRVRLVLMHFISCKQFNIYPRLWLPFSREMTEKFKNAPSPQFTNQLNKTRYMWKTFLRIR